MCCEGWFELWRLFENGSMAEVSRERDMHVTLYVRFTCVQDGRIEQGV